MPKRRRWFRWLLAGIGIVVLAGGTFWFVAVRQGSSELNRVRTELDATEPGWRLDEMLAAGDAARPRDDENSVLLASAVAPQIPVSYRTWRADRPDDPDWPPEPPHQNRLPRPDTVCEAMGMRGEAADAIVAARRLRDRPRGGTKIVIPANPMGALLPHVQNVRETAALLRFDAMVSALNGDADQSVASLHAGLHVARGIGNDPFLISMLVRIACDALVVGGLQQTLAWSEPRAGLAELQIALAEEAAAPILLDGLRGERASVDRIFEAIADGTITPNQLVTGGAGLTPAQIADMVRYRPHMRRDHALALETLTQMMEVARRPPEDWQSGTAAVSLPPADHRHIVSRSLIVATPPVAAAALRNVALLRTAVVGIACERFRQSHGRWPESLAELPRDLIAELPLDPFDGQPLRFLRLDDGVVVYTVGPNRIDDGGRLHRTEEDKEMFPDMGFRLWDPAQRAAPPAVPSPTLAP